MNTLLSLIENEISIKDSIFFGLIFSLDKQNTINVEFLFLPESIDTISYPYETKILFTSEIMVHFPGVVQKLIEELEACYNNKCCTACGFLVRRSGNFISH